MRHGIIKTLKQMTLMGILIVVLQACKNEFMPDPVGEAIPPAQFSVLAKALDSSPYTLFKAAWNRSDMDKLIADSLPQAKLTFFVPTDGAMRQAGYTLDQINAAPVAELNTLLRYHVINGETSREQLNASTSQQTFTTFLIHPEFKDMVNKRTGGYNSRQFRYQHTIGAAQDGIVANGMVIKTGTEIPVANGRIIPVEKVLEIPARQMIDVLRADTRFSLFVEAMDQNAALYDGYVLTDFGSTSYVPYKYLADWYAQTDGGYRGKEFLPIIIRHTLFAPTNEAFNQIGIYTANDIRALNSRGNGSINFGVASTPSDSLLTNQRIAICRMELDIDWDLFVPGQFVVYAAGANAVFYSQSLNNQLLGNYYLQTLRDIPQYLDIDFGKDAGGRITLKNKGSAGEAATIIEENINTAQGPIHVVNRIMVPNGFTMWHKK